MSWIPEKKKAWKMYSVRAMLLASAIQGAWMALPKDMQDSIPQTWVMVAGSVLMVLGIVGRLWDQPEVKE